MGVLGQAIREYDHSAFEHYEYLSLDEPGWYTRIDGHDMEFWYWSSGQEGDVCVKCEKDICGDANMLINHGFPSSRCMCMKCGEKHLTSSIVRY